MLARKSLKSRSKIPSAEPLVRPGSKLARVLTLMQRQKGATVEELATATGWQQHTVRGAIAGAVKKKLRLKVKVLMEGDRRAYAIDKLATGKRAAPAAKATTAKAIVPGPVTA
jgi:hypothetical protein